MAEVSKDAMLLITISWQALKRAELNNRATILCDTTVLMLFASIYIEANLNYIIDKMGMTDEMRKFYGKKEGNFRPGLQQKLVWFYNKFIARKKRIMTRILKKLRKNYGENFQVIRRFINFVMKYLMVSLPGQLVTWIKQLIYDNKLKILSVS